jgi:hypothetical protein
MLTITADLTRVPCGAHPLEEPFWLPIAHHRADVLRITKVALDGIKLEGAEPSVSTRRK